MMKVIIIVINGITYIRKKNKKGVVFISSTNRGYKRHKSDEKEKFITIENFNNYEISNFGRVKNKKN